MSASPSLRKQLERRLRDFDDADTQIKAAMDAIAEREMLPSPVPPYEAAAHRCVLEQHSGKATKSLVEMLELRLCVKCTRPMQLPGAGHQQAARCADHARCREQPESRGGGQDEATDSTRADAQRYRWSNCRCRDRHPSSTSSKVVTTSKVDTRRSQAPPVRQLTQKQPTVHYTKDWSKVQSKWHENNKCHGKGSKTKLLQDVEGRLVRFSEKEIADAAARASARASADDSCRYGQPTVIGEKEVDRR